jgi:uncharacterized protein YuzE
MTVTIAGIEFDGVEYDSRGDVLYLSVGAPREPAHTLATTEGHAVDYEAGGKVIGMVLVNVRWTLKSEGRLTVTLPEHPAVADSRELAAALA